MTTEFKTLEEMTPEELAEARRQKWTLEKSTTAWWIKRNHTAFMPVHSEARGIFILESYGIKVYGVVRSQPEATPRDFAEMRRDQQRLMQGKGPSLARRVWRFFGGDAA